MTWNFLTELLKQESQLFYPDMVSGRPQTLKALSEPDTPALSEKKDSEVAQAGLELSLQRGGACAVTASSLFLNSILQFCPSLAVPFHGLEMDIWGWGGWPQFSLRSEDDLELLTLLSLPFQELGIQAPTTTAGWVWGDSVTKGYFLRPTPGSNPGA